MLTFDLVTHDRLRAEEEERKRRERDAHDLAQGSMSNLLTLVDTGQVSAVMHQLKVELPLVMLDKGYQAVNSQYPMTRDTFADYLTELTDPGHLGRTFQTAIDQGIITDQAFAEKTAKRFDSLSAIAQHSHDPQVRLDNEVYWNLMSAADQGQDAFTTRKTLVGIQPGGARTAEEERLMASNTPEEYQQNLQAGNVFQRLATPMIPKAALEAVGGVPIVGKPLEQTLAMASAPLTLAAAPLAPAAVAESVVGAGILGGAAEEAGLSPEIQKAAGLVGAVAGPGLGALAERVPAIPIRTTEEAITIAKPRPPFVEKVPIPRGAAEVPPEDIVPEVPAAPVTPLEIAEQAGVGKLYRALAASTKARALTVEQIAARRSAGAGAIQGIREAAAPETVQQSLSMGAAARRGITPAELELPGAFTTEEINTLVHRVFTSPLLRPHEAENAGLAMNKLLIEQRQLMPSEAGYITKAIPELAPVIRNITTKQGNAAWQAAAQIMNLPRTVMTAFDLSAPLRQGIMLAPSHPVEFTKAWGPMVKSFLSEDATQVVDEAIRATPNWQLKEASKLYIAPVSEAGGIVAREEAYYATWAEKIPVLGGMIRRSERSYITFLNKLRSDVFDTVDHNWQGTGKTLEDYTALSDFINKASGRGSLGRLNPTAPYLSAAFFAPRFMVSRPQAFLSLLTTSPAARVMVARDLAAFMGTGIATLSMIKLSGLADVELDPRNTDFGKIRVGKTRYDFWGGTQPWVRYAAQLITGQRKAGSGFTYDTNRLATLGRFFQGKLSPQAGLVVDMLGGQTFVGEELKPSDPKMWQTQAFNRLVPMFIQDVVDATREHGTKGVLVGLPSGFGLGVQTYTTPFDELRTVRTQIMAEQGVTEEAAKLDPSLLLDVQKDPRYQAVQQKLDADAALHGGSVESVFYRYVRDLRQQQQTDQTTDDQRRSQGLITAEEWRTRTADRASKTFSAINGAQTVAGVTYDEGGPAGPIPAARDAYYAVDIAAFTDPVTGNVDWGAFKQAQEATLSGLSPSDRDSVLQLIRKNWTPGQWDMEAKEEQLQPYFDIPEQVYQRQRDSLRLTAPTYAEYQKEVIEAGTQQAIKAGKSPQEASAYALLPDVTRVAAPQYKRLQDAISREREAWRRKNPKLANLAVELGYNPASRESYRRTTQQEPLVLPLPSGQLTGGW